MLTSLAESSMFCFKLNAKQEYVQQQIKDAKPRSKYLCKGGEDRTPVACCTGSTINSLARLFAGHVHLTPAERIQLEERLKVTGAVVVSLSSCSSALRAFILSQELHRRCDEKLKYSSLF